MSAHAYTGLKEVQRLLDDGKMDHVFFILRPALDFSTWTEDLSLDDYIDLNSVVTNRSDEIHYLVKKLVIKYEVEWNNLGYPTNRQEWNDARLPPED